VFPVQLYGAHFAESDGSHPKPPPESGEGAFGPPPEQSWLERETDEDEPLDENENQRIAEDDGNDGFELYWIWILLWI
jgi:hypothetical protein